ncbi:MAG: PAS domain-containing protein [Myxococcales bacterium]
MDERCRDDKGTDVGIVTTETATGRLTAAGAHPEPAGDGGPRLFEELARHLMVWIKDESGRYLYVSPSFLTRFALTIPEVLGHTDAELFPNDAKEIRANDLKVLTTRERIEVVERARDSQGVLRSWFVTKFFLSSPTGPCAAGMAFDVTEYERVDKASRDSEATYQQILDSLADMVLVKGENSRVLWANRAFRDVYGMTNEQLRGMIDAPFVEPDYTQQYVKDDQEVFVTGKILNIPEEPIRRHDGTILTVHSVKSPVFDRQGKVIKTVGVFRDITERKRLELELRQAQKLESVGLLASGIAHEINTPIQFVGDQTQFVQSAVGDLMTLCQKYRSLIANAAPGAFVADELAAIRELEEAADLDYVADHLPAAFVAILDGTSRVTKLVQAMKEFAHPDGSDRAPADINQALHNTLIMANNQLKYVAAVEVELAEIPLVTCRIGELNQVFLNILVNAGHAIAEAIAGSARLGRIRVTSRQEGQAVVISIEDSGTGIPEAARARVFDPFFTTKEVGRGTGQGLAIARAMVEKQGGTITFDTEMGRGTTFHVRVPIGA